MAVARQNAEFALSGFEFRLDSHRLHPSGARARLSARVIMLDGSSADLPAVDVTLRTALEPTSVPGSLTVRPRRPQAPRAHSDVRPIRLLCFARSLDFGGSQLRLAELVQHLQSSGDFDTTVVAPSDGGLRHLLESAGAFVQIAKIRIDDAGAYEEQLTAMAKRVAHRFDLVLAGTLTSFPAIDLANRLGLPSVWRIGEVEPLSAVVDWLGQRLDPSVELRASDAFNTASAVLFNSDAALRKHCRPGMAERCILQANGTDVAGSNAYMQATSRAACRQALGVAPDRRLLICSGTVWPIKGQALLVSALKHMRAGQALECVMIGQRSEPYASRLASLIRHHGLGGCVRLIPFCDDLRPWWRAADAAVCPSESESMPAAVLEAMAFGLPVLATRVGGIPDIVEDGVSGWLCEPNDLGSLIAGLERVTAATSEEIQEFGNLAALHVRKNYNCLEGLPRITALLRRIAHGNVVLTSSA